MIETNLPILYLREVVLLPFNEIRLEFTEDKEKNILDISMKNYDSNILLINLADPLEEAPLINDLSNVGILAKIKSKIDLPNGITRVVLKGIDRVTISSYVEDTTVLSAFVVPTKEYDYNEVEAAALKRVLYRKLDEYIDISPYMSNTVLGRINDVKNISKLSDIIVAELPLEYNENGNSFKGYYVKSEYKNLEELKKHLLTFLDESLIKTELKLSDINNKRMYDDYYEIDGNLYCRNYSGKGRLTRYTGNYDIEIINSSDSRISGNIVYEYLTEESSCDVKNLSKCSNSNFKYELGKFNIDKVDNNYVVTKIDFHE